jgi:uncharacterized membrane protein YhaH (DUF805 family)
VGGADPAVAGRRLADPKHFLDFLFAGVVVWAIVELGVMPGEQGANRYGPNPLKPASAV